MKPTESMSPQIQESQQYQLSRVGKNILVGLSAKSSFKQDLARASFILQSSQHLSESSPHCNHSRELYIHFTNWMTSVEKDEQNVFDLINIIILLFFPYFIHLLKACPKASNNEFSSVKDTLLNKCFLGHKKESLILI